MTASLAYRKNEAAIRRGDVPEKYTRLLPFITGNRILEVGSAEGVLALLLAKSGRTVTAIEKSRERYESAIDLCAEWQRRERFTAPNFINDTIGDNLGLLRDADTLVGIRVIYYLHDDLARMLDAAAEARVSSIVFCGNRSRAQRWREGVPDELAGAENFFASSEGMASALRRAGYRIASIEEGGDPIVIGAL